MFDLGVRTVTMVLMVALLIVLAWLVRLQRRHFECQARINDAVNARLDKITAIVARATR
jgi:lipopolysaccharide export system protein LptC